MDPSGLTGDEALTLLIVVGLVVYLFPTIVAFLRGAPDRGSVLVLNVFLGWTLIGWVTALALAARSR